MSNGAPYFDRAQNQPYADDLWNYRFPWAVNAGLELLDRVQTADLAAYDSPKGTPFYFMGIAAFASHDYQTATFFFDAAVSEDVRHYPTNNDTPTLLFMRLEALDGTKYDQLASNIAASCLHAIACLYVP
jgi:hypothetical protein